jgi:hypothetical protein
LNSRAKGKRAELSARDVLRLHGYTARRGVQYNGCADAPDVISNFPWHIEAKHVEKLNIWAALQQAEKECGTKRPCLFFKRNRSEWYIAFRAEDILKELREVQGERA